MGSLRNILCHEHFTPLGPAYWPSSLSTRRFRSNRAHMTASLPPASRQQAGLASPTPNTWMGLTVRVEGSRIGYDRDAFGSAYSSLEDELIAGLPQRGGQVLTPYTCTSYAIRPDGTAATDVDHIVALAEAYDSGLTRSRFREFGGDIENLTIAVPSGNRYDKGDRDAAEWIPEHNRGWYAARLVAVKRKYGLSVDRAERDQLAAVLAADPKRRVECA